LLENIENFVEDKKRVARRIVRTVRRRARCARRHARVLRRERKIKRCVRKTVKVYKRCTLIFRRVPPRIMDRGWSIKPRVFQRVSRRTITLSKKIKKVLVERKRFRCTYRRTVRKCRRIKKSC